MEDVTGLSSVSLGDVTGVSSVRAFGVVGGLLASASAVGAMGVLGKFEWRCRFSAPCIKTGVVACIFKSCFPPGLGGLGMTRLSQCSTPFCRARTGQCCLLIGSRRGPICPTSC